MTQIRSSATKKNRTNWIPVVAALIQREGRILLGQRPVGQTMPGVWEFPGGKIESGESPEEALERELHEELGVHAQVGPLAFAATHNYGATGILLLFFHVSFWKGELKSVHHTDIRWVLPSELGEMALPDANRKILPRILASLSEHGARSLHP